jgi:2-polyprenyl-6-methoxyphenol hydroxylase-like FAD-dependent oxidoreductase
MHGLNGKADVVVVGGGIAGSSLAAVLARSGVGVVVLERQTVYRDHVRGEYMQPWGVAEAQALDLCGAFERAGGIYVQRAVPYDEIRSTEAAEAASRDLRILPGVPGALCAGHPAACEALIQTAEATGALVIRGVDRVRITPGRWAEVRFDVDGAEKRLSCRLVIGADGRASTVRAQAAIPLHQAAATHLIAGLLVDGVPTWPQDSQSVGTEGDVMFFVFPQGGERVRLYCCTALDQRDRFAGPGGQTRFMDTFRELSALPHARAIANGTPIGPCATLTGEDTWTDAPFVEGVALIGDAAGYNDPIIGQGLSLALRDVRMLSQLLLANEDWSPARLRPYADERHERMRRVRFTAALLAALASQFGTEASERRRRFRMRIQEGSDPDLQFALAAAPLGPDKVPAFAFEDSMREKVLQC